MSSKWFLVLVCTLRFVTLSRSQDLGPWTDSYLEGLAPAKHFRGTIVVERNGQVLVEKSYGTAVEEWNVPNSAETAIVPQMSEGYSREGSTLIRREYFDRSMETGAGGIYTTAEDMLRWNKGLDSTGLLSAQARDFMFTAHPPGNYGAGWFIETSPRRKIYHEGGDPGFAAFEARYPDQHVVIIVLSNEDDSPVRDIADAMAKHLFGD